jgi:hypothetical protein
MVPEVGETCALIEAWSNFRVNVVEQTLCKAAFSSTPTSKVRSLGTPERKKPLEFIGAHDSNPETAP